jgi:glutamate-ammonia-ligase adenylyltransferase
MVQYSVLRWAYQHTELIDFTDNIRLLGRLGTAGLLAMADVRLLSDAYRHYRATVHRQTLQEQPAVVAQGQFQAEREEVRRLWHQLMEDQPHS